LIIPQGIIFKDYDINAITPSDTTTATLFTLEYYEQHKDELIGPAGPAGPTGPQGEAGDHDTWYSWLFDAGNTLANVAEGIGLYSMQADIVALQGEIGAVAAMVSESNELNDVFSDLNYIANNNQNIGQGVWGKLGNLLKEFLRKCNQGYTQLENGLEAIGEEGYEMSVEPWFDIDLDVG
jgi:hypothetical protein